MQGSHAGAHESLGSRLNSPEQPWIACRLAPGAASCAPQVAANLEGGIGDMCGKQLGDGYEDKMNYAKNTKAANMFMASESNVKEVAGW